MQEAVNPEKYVAPRRPLAALVYASLLSARREVEEKQLLEEAQNRLPPKQFNPGDLCTVWRPPIASIHAVYGRAKASWCRPERLR